MKSSMSMILTLLFISVELFRCVSTKNCYGGFLKFDDNQCQKNSHLKMFSNEFCNEIKCAGNATDLNYFVCIHQKHNTFTLILFGENTKQFYEIPLKMNDNDLYSVTQIAISDTHIILFLISSGAAYRTEFSINGIEIQPTSLELEYLGIADRILWESHTYFDKYMEVNFTTTEILKTSNISRNNQKNATRGDNACNKFADFEIPSTFPTQSPQTIITIEKEAVIFICGAFAFFLMIAFLIVLTCLVYKRKRSRRNVGNVYSADPITLSNGLPPPAYTTCQRPFFAEINSLITQHFNTRSENEFDANVNVTETSHPVVLSQIDMTGGIFVNSPNITQNQDQGIEQNDPNSPIQTSCLSRRICEESQSSLAEFIPETETSCNPSHFSLNQLYLAAHQRISDKKNDSDSLAFM